MNNDTYYEAHLIGGPQHGATIVLHEPLHEYRVSAPPQHRLRADERDAVRLTLKIGRYERTASLTIDPCTLKPCNRSPYRFVYEWIGWES